MKSCVISCKHPINTCESQWVFPPAVASSLAEKYLEHPCRQGSLLKMAFGCVGKPAKIARWRGTMKNYPIKPVWPCLTYDCRISQIYLVVGPVGRLGSWAAAPAITGYRAMGSHGVLQMPRMPSRAPPAKLAMISKIKLQLWIWKGYPTPAAQLRHQEFLDPSLRPAAL